MPAIPQQSPAADRNKAPILERLTQVLPEHCHILEIASGTGQHADFFTEHQDNWEWQPTDKSPAALESIGVYQVKAARPNFLPPLKLDVEDDIWPESPFDAIFNANMIHISPWSCCLALFKGAAGTLKNGQLILYGPFIQEGTPTAPSNLDFDASLRQRDSSWGIRKLADVAGVASTHGFILQHNFPMPANNRLVVFRNGPSGNA